MHTLVIGGGVIGMTTAWHLAKSGHQVTLIERQSGPALETSFANAGMLSTGYSTPWAAPGVPRKALGWLLSRHAPLRFRPTFDWQQYQWMWQMWRQCSVADYKRNKSRLLQLALYSQDRMQVLDSELGLNYEQRQLGTLQLFRSQKQWLQAQQDCDILDHYGIPYRSLSARELVEAEPGLASGGERTLPYCGGLQITNDSTGDCYQFTRKLSDACEKLGVEMRYGHQVEGMSVANGKVNTIQFRGPDNEIMTMWPDAVVIAAGSLSRKLMKKSLGINLPTYPVKGYSLTLDVDDEAGAPQSTLMDETFKVAVTRFDNRIRVGGIAELSGYSSVLRQSAIDTLRKVGSDMFPTATNWQTGKAWTGLRPMTPDSTPIIGPSGIEGLYLNTGHGSLGWTLACGSAQLLTDTINGQSTALNPDGYALSRFGRPMVSGVTYRPLQV
ncbi:MAG: D-amino acid dehydrogenase [Pseudohongiella nitratireducens]|nr:D-amino acid dehydrogenase [Pseudohongiella nitratireducens]MDF1623482.1 D-amino acid dehydrogenase [Pseudohongiella nitratireducens]